MRTKWTPDSDSIPRRLNSRESLFCQIRWSWQKEARRARAIIFKEWTAANLSSKGTISRETISIETSIRIECKEEDRLSISFLIMRERNICWCSRLRREWGLCIRLWWVMCLKVQWFGLRSSRIEVHWDGLLWSRKGCRGRFKEEGWSLLGIEVIRKPFLIWIV